MFLYTPRVLSANINVGHGDSNDNRRAMPVTATSCHLSDAVAGGVSAAPRL